MFSLEQYAVDRVDNVATNPLRNFHKWYAARSHLDYDEARAVMDDEIRALKPIFSFNVESFCSEIIQHYQHGASGRDPVYDNSHRRRQRIEYEALE